ncbi:MAG: histidine kinase [Gammaproteobacteria bacterium]|nr:histidine kinase [Gammaproteobacteria bacterium]NNJ92958.1 histidine kinase [Gammaproteobacteria bacterium]
MKNLPAARNFLFHDPDEAIVNQRIKQIILSARLVWPLTLLISGLLLSAFLLITTFVLEFQILHWRQLLIFFSLLSLLSFFIAFWRFYQQLLKPMAKLESSVAHVCQGESDDISLSENMGIFDGMARDLGSINEELIDLYEDMDVRVARQTTRLAQKTASLKILYDVAATINESGTLEEMLLRFLRVLKEMVNGKAAIVRLTTENGQMKLIGSIGLENTVLTEEQMFPVQLCVCGTALTPGDILCEKDPAYCSRVNGRKMFSNDEIEVVSVPLEYHDELLGNYSIFVEKSGITEREDIMELLATIGSHLGMAVAKHHSDENAHRLSIVEERSSFAHELHDSLAQTLASLRFQVRMMEDSLDKTQLSENAVHDLERIRNGLDEAHVELRELLNNFRAPLDERGLVSGLEKVSERFEHETGIHTFFQHNCQVINLTVSEQMQIVRILQESLANIRKHAQAQIVRVLLTCVPKNGYRILVEDDGVGFTYSDKDGKPGEHIGLSIMEERALKLGGEIRIESEPGEGTRIELIYNPRMN